MQALTSAPWQVVGPLEAAELSADIVAICSRSSKNRKGCCRYKAWAGENAIRGASIFSYLIILPSHETELESFAFLETSRKIFHF
jgi:hypothetical protein